jgi:hypothetical protein
MKKMDMIAPTLIGRAILAAVGLVVLLASIGEGIGGRIGVARQA